MSDKEQREKKGDPREGNEKQTNNQKMKERERPPVGENGKIQWKGLEGRKGRRKESVGKKEW